MVQIFYCVSFDMNGVNYVLINLSTACVYNVVFCFKKKIFHSSLAKLLELCLLQTNNKENNINILMPYYV